MGVATASSRGTQASPGTRTGRRTAVHLEVQVLVQVVLGDLRLRQVPLLGHLLAGGSSRSDHRRPPLVGEDGATAVRSSCSTWAGSPLVLTRDRRTSSPSSSNASMAATAGPRRPSRRRRVRPRGRCSRPRSTWCWRRHPGELGADQLDAVLLEDLLRTGEAGLEHVDAGQDAQRQHLAALADLVDQELGGVGPEGVATDRLDERDRAVGVHPRSNTITGIPMAHASSTAGVSVAACSARRSGRRSPAGERLDVRDLLVVRRLGVEHRELGDLEDAHLGSWS